MNYAGCTNEELVKIITAGDDAAYETLFRNLRPIILHEAEIYRGQMETYDIVWKRRRCLQALLD